MCSVLHNPIPSAPFFLPASASALGWALKLRWLWLQKTEPEKAWSFFPIQAQHQVQSFFAMAVKTVIGNGKNTSFWTDGWLLDQSLK